MTYSEKKAILEDIRERRAMLPGLMERRTELMEVIGSLPSMSGDGSGVHGSDVSSRVERQAIYLAQIDTEIEKTIKLSLELKKAVYGANKGRYRVALILRYVEWRSAGYIKRSLWKRHSPKDPKINKRYSRLMRSAINSLDIDSLARYFPQKPEHQEQKEPPSE